MEGKGRVMETEIMHGGEGVLLMGIAQKKDSVILSLKAHPVVETFFREVSGDKTDQVAARGGGYWYGVEDKDLRIYKVGPGGFNGANYSLDNEGYQLMVDNGLGPQTVNLSFLRLKGISGPNGVKLGVFGVMSLSSRRHLKDMVKAGVSRFVRDYLVPVTIELDIRVDERVDNTSRIYLGS